MKKTKNSMPKTATTPTERPYSDPLALAPALLRLMNAMHRGEREAVMNAIGAELNRLGRGTLFEVAMKCTPPTSAPDPIARSENWLLFAGSPCPATRARALAVLTVLGNADDIAVIEAMADRLGPSRAMHANSTRAACAAATAQRLHCPTH